MFEMERAQGGTWTLENIPDPVPLNSTSNKRRMYDSVMFDFQSLFVVPPPVRRSNVPVVLIMRAATIRDSSMVIWCRTHPGCVLS